VRPILDKLEFDGGVACEAFDAKTGKPFSGLAFATCAGFLAWALWKAYGRAEGTPPPAQNHASLLVPAPAPGAVVKLPKNTKLKKR
jgi:hypothetical protein